MDSFSIQRGLNPEWLIFNNGKNDLIKSGEESLIYYGRVVYRDTLYAESVDEGLHETTFCFLYQPDEERFVRSGPIEYNRFT